MGKQKFGERLEIRLSSRLKQSCESVAEAADKDLSEWIRDAMREKLTRDRKHPALFFPEQEHVAEKTDKYKEGD